jgi:hypothetical protein
MGALLGVSHHSCLSLACRGPSDEATTIGSPFLDRRHPPDEHTRDASKLRQLCLQLASIPKSSSSTIIVFSLPQIFFDNLLVRNLFRTLSLNHNDSKKNGLTLLAIDEVHLFAQFGLYFRDEFLQLRPLVFDKLSNFYRSTVPILFMSATVTTFMVEHFLVMFYAIIKNR